MVDIKNLEIDFEKDNMKDMFSSIEKNEENIVNLNREIVIGIFKSMENRNGWTIEDTLKVVKKSSKNVEELIYNYSYALNLVHKYKSDETALAQSIQSDPILKEKLEDAVTNALFSIRD